MSDDICTICLDAINFGDIVFVHGTPGSEGHRIHSACMIRWARVNPERVTCPNCKVNVGSIADVANNIRQANQYRVTGTVQQVEAQMFPDGLPRSAQRKLPEVPRRRPPADAAWGAHGGSRAEIRLSPEEQERRYRHEEMLQNLALQAAERDRIERPRRQAAEAAAAEQLEIDELRRLHIQSGFIDPHPRAPRQEGSLDIVMLGAIGVGVGGTLAYLGPNMFGMVASSLIVFSICTWGGGKRGGTRRKKSLKRLKRGGNNCITGEIDFSSANPLNDFLSKVDSLNKQNVGKQNLYSINFDNIDLKTSEALIKMLNIDLDGPIHVSKIK